MIIIHETRKGINKHLIVLTVIALLMLVIPYQIKSTRIKIDYPLIEKAQEMSIITLPELIEEKKEIQPTINLYENCIWFLKASEGLRLKEYRCVANRRTIGWGHWIKEGESFSTLTVAQADELFKQDFNKDWNYVGKRYPNITIEARWAITLFVYNVGSGNLEGSKLDTSLKRGDYNKAAIQILSFNKARKHSDTCSRNCKKCRPKPYTGLTKKRKFEAALLRGDFKYIAARTEATKAAVIVKINKALNLIQ